MTRVTTGRKQAFTEEVPQSLVAGGIEFRPEIRRWLDRGAVVLAVVGLIVGLWLLWRYGRGQWFFSDEWAFLVGRRHLSVEALLEPHNEHWVTFPVLIFQAVFSVAGLQRYEPYLAVALLFHLTATTAASVALRRAGVPLAVVVPAGLALLMMGSAVEQILWAFQLAWTGSIALFLVALMLVRRAEPPVPHLATAALCLAVAQAFQGISLPLTLGVGVGLVARGRFRHAAVVTGPALGVYGVWQLVFGSSPGIVLGAVSQVPAYAAHGVISATAALLGLGVAVATVLAALLFMAAVAQLGLGRLPLEGWVGLVALVAFYGMTGLGRAHLGIDQAASGRYFYLAALLLLLVLAGLGPLLWPTGHLTPRALLVSLLLLIGLFANMTSFPFHAAHFRDLKLVSAERVLAAQELLMAGLPYEARAQPDPEYASDLSMGSLAELVEAGHVLGHSRPPRIGERELEEARLRTQIAKLPAMAPTAALVVTDVHGLVLPEGESCARVVTPLGGWVAFESSPGIVGMEAFSGGLVEVRRTDERPFTRAAWFGVHLSKDDSVSLSVVTQAAPDADGPIVLRFTQPADLRLCGASISLQTEPE